MEKHKGFLKIDRELPAKRKVEERINDWKEIYQDFPQEKTVAQAHRCMDCGVPFCHQGCPLGNMIPDFNKAVQDNAWEEATEILLSTNNFPEFTGRICPAPCEHSCVLAINKPAVAIEHIEKEIAEKAFEMGLIKAASPKERTGKKVAIVGSGPAGLAAAAQLNQAGHLVTVYERDPKIGGLLRYGIPDFKMEKWVIDRRLAIMEEEGVIFKTGTAIGEDMSLKELQKDYDAVLLCIGALKPRALPIPGAELKGVHFAMDYLTPQNKKVGGEALQEGEWINAADKHVLVIGGGDTGSDCVGTANRHKAKSISQLQYRPMPPKERAMANPWPEWPMIFESSSSHEEGCERVFGWLTKEFVGNEKGEVTGLKLSKLNWKNDGSYEEMPGEEKILACDLALIAIGFERPQHDAFSQEFDFELDNRGNFKVENWQSNVPGIFAAGDASRGQSLVVWAIADGREAARSIDKHLMGKSELAARDEVVAYGG